MSESYVVMLSGGADSTFLLYKLLTGTEHPVHVHHIVLKNINEPRWEKEKEAVTKIVAYCRQNYRDFSYSESIYSLGHHRNYGADIDLQLFIGARVAMNCPGEKVTVAIGSNKDDRDHYEKASEIYGIADGCVQNLFEAAIACLRKKDREKINRKPYRPLRNMSKYDIIKELPGELFDLTWSCRRPRNNKPCNLCRTCRDIHRVKNLMAAKGIAGQEPKPIKPAERLQIVENKDHALLYNSLSGDSLVVNRDAINFFNACKNGIQYHDIVDHHNSPNVERFIEVLMQKHLVTAAGVPRLTVDFSNSEKKLGKGRLIKNLRLNVTEACNLNCKYCYQKQSNVFTKRRTMDWPVAKRSLDGYLNLIKRNLNDSGLIRFFGGEPMLNWDLVRKCLSYLGSVSVGNVALSCMMNTNGTIMNKAFAREIYDFGLKVVVSLDGIGEQHDTFRKFPTGKGSFDIIEKNLKLLLTQDCDVGIAVVLSDQNYHNLKDLIDFVDVLQEQYDAEIPIGFGAVCRTERKDLDTLPVSEKIKLLGDAVRYAKAKGISTESGTTHFSFLQLYSGNLLGCFCAGAGCELSISPQGEIYPCAGSETRLGHIDNLNSVFTSEEYLQIASTRVGKIEECDGCEIEVFCGGGCIADRQHLGKRGDGNEACEFKKGTYKELVRTYLLS